MRFLALFALAACATPAYRPRAPNIAPAVKAPSLGVELEAPGDLRVFEESTTVHMSNGTFKLNLFVVDDLSAQSAAAQRLRVENEPDFVRLTHEHGGATTWRFDYELTDGKAGTISRIYARRALDCGVHDVSPDVAAAVAAACATAKSI